ncbi:Amino acid permease 6, partial [Bienertia sinuspersici]
MGGIKGFRVRGLFVVVKVVWIGFLIGGLSWVGVVERGGFELRWSAGRVNRLRVVVMGQECGARGGGGGQVMVVMSQGAVKRSNCFHKYGHNVKCSTSNTPFMILFGCIQILLSQIPNFSELSWLSMVAAIMSFAYSSIGLALSIAKVVGGGMASTSLTGVTVGVDVTAKDKVWRCFQAIGDIAFAYAYSNVLIEIQA